MGELPKDTIYDILSRMPVKSLARFRCVCKQWCKCINDPYLANIHVKQEFTPIILSPKPSSSTLISFLHVTEGTTSTILEVKKESSTRFPGVYTSKGSCNGLILTSCYYINCITIYVINPLRKEFYELPRIDGISSVLRKIGLGFDDSTNTFKIIYVFIRNPGTINIEALKENQCTMVHVLGTDLWREIPQVPFYPITGEAVFSHGCLHWITAILRLGLQNREHKVVLFDVKKEEFGSIDSPKQKGNRKLVNLNGEVGLVYNIIDISIKVWILKQKEWMIQCQFDHKWPLPRGHIVVLDCWNKDGDILMTSNQRWYVYSLKSGTSHKANIVGREDGSKWANIRMYQSNLLSIHSVNTNSYSVKKLSDLSIR